MIPFPEQIPAQAVRTRDRRVLSRPHRRRKPSDPRSWNLTLASAGTAVPARTVVASPGLLAAAVEDLQWRLAMEELLARKPRRRQKAEMAAWLAEADRLEDKRRRIAEITAEAINAM
jgi:hypothetical protein